MAVGHIFHTENERERGIIYSMWSYKGFHYTYMGREREKASSSINGVS